MLLSCGFTVRGVLWFPASIACPLLYEGYVWVSLGCAMKAKQSKAVVPCAP